MIECPKCGGDAGVYNGFADQEELRYIRRRKCKLCEHKFITVEVISDTEIQGTGTHGGGRARKNPATPEGGENLFTKKRKTEQTIRPCETDGGKAYFHRWVQDERAITFALIEYLDGTVEKVNPETVRFTDR